MEKGAEFHAQLLGELVGNDQALYLWFKRVICEIRNNLKSVCSEDSLSHMIDDLQNLTDTANGLFSEIRNKSTPSQEIICKQDIEAVTKDVLSLLQTRSVEFEEDFDQEEEAVRLRDLLNHDYARSVYGSTVSKIKSTNLACSQSFQTRADVAADLTAKETEMKMEATIEAQRVQLNKLELEKEINMLKAKLQAYDSVGQHSQDQHSVLPETHSANTRVSPPRSSAQHCQSSSSSSTTAPSTPEGVLTSPLLAFAPEFVPVSSIYPTSQLPDRLILQHDSSNTSQQLQGNSTTGLAQASLHAQPFQQSFSAPAHLPALNSMSASTQASYHPRPLQQSLSASAYSPTVTPQLL